MDTLSFVAILFLVASIPLTTVLSLKVVLNFVKDTQTVGGLPKELRAKELEIVGIQTQITKLKEETRQSINNRVNSSAPPPVNPFS